MICLKCGGSSRVIESRNIDGMIIRHRWCIKCRDDYYTKEVVIDYEEGRKAKNRAIYALKNKAADHSS